MIYDPSRVEPVFGKLSRVQAVANELCWVVDNHQVGDLTRYLTSLFNRMHVEAAHLSETIIDAERHLLQKAGEHANTDQAEGQLTFDEAGPQAHPLGDEGTHPVASGP